MDPGASSGQMSVIPDDTAVGGEVNIQTFGAIDVGMPTLLVFLICSDHLFSMLDLSLAYKAVIHVGGFASGRRGVFKLQNCPLAFLAYCELAFCDPHCLGFIMHYAQISVVYVVVC